MINIAKLLKFLLIALSSHLTLDRVHMVDTVKKRLGQL